MLDVVFILLIFFLVTASFVSDPVVEIDRPAASHTTTRDGGTLQVRIDASDRVWIEGRGLDVRRVGANVARFLAEWPEGPVVVQTHPHSTAGALVAVVDQSRLAGATRVILAEEAAATRP